MPPLSPDGLCSRLDRAWGQKAAFGHVMNFAQVAAGKAAGYENFLEVFAEFGTTK